MNNPKYTLPIEFTLIEPREFSRTGTLIVSTDFRYVSGFKKKEDIKAVKEAFNLIRRTGISEMIMKDDTSFPSKLRIIYSLAEVMHGSPPRIDISPIEDQIILSSLGLRSYDKYPKPDIFEARSDAIDLEYEFADLTLRFSPTNEAALLAFNNAQIKEVKQWL